MTPKQERLEKFQKTRTIIFKLISSEGDVYEAFFKSPLLKHLYDEKKISLKITNHSNYFTVPKEFSYQDTIKLVSYVYSKTLSGQLQYLLKNDDGGRLAPQQEIETFLKNNREIDMLNTPYATHTDLYKDCFINFSSYEMLKLGLQEKYYYSVAKSPNHINLYLIDSKELTKKLLEKNKVKSVAPDYFDWYIPNVTIEEVLKITSKLKDKYTIDLHNKN